MKGISRTNELRGEVDDIRWDSSLKAWEKWREIGTLVLDDLKGHGHFFNSPSGLFCFDKEHKRAFPLHEDIGFAAVINQRFGINPKEPGFKRVLADLQGEAFFNGRPLEVRRLAHYDRDSNLLYVSQFNGSMYKLDGNCVVTVDNGEDDVFFLDDLRAWETYNYIPNSARGGIDKQLIDSVNFVESTLSAQEQRLFLKIWLMAVFFGNVQPTKIILLLLGEQGSGKTSALRRIQKLLFGSKVNLLSIEKEKQDGFVATITTDPIALFDNLDEKISWLPYHLSRLATGVTFSRRQLYTTNDKVEFPGVSWLGITSRTVDFMSNQPDLPDRTLVLKLGRLVERRPEEDLLNSVAKHRNALWSELLDELNKIVGYLKQHPEPVPVQFRMADFASFALKVATAWGCRSEIEQAFKKLEQAQSELVFENEALPTILGLWLIDEANQGRKVTAGVLFKEWKELATNNHFNWPFANSKSLGQRLGQLRSALSQQFEVDVTWDAHSKQNHYQFWPQRDCEVVPVSATTATETPIEQPEEVEVG